MAQPVTPDASRPSCWTVLAFSRGRPATSRRLGQNALRPAPRYRRPSAAGARRYVETEDRELSGSKIMLVDSHCHLDFPDFADDLEGDRRARGSRRRRPHGHHLDRACDGSTHCSRSPSAFRRLLLGRHPSAPGRRRRRHSPAERADRADQASEGRWRSARRGSTISMSTVRARRRSAAFARISRRRARNRPAAGHPYPRRRRRSRPHPRRRNARRAHSPAVLHCYTGGRELGDEGDRARALDLVHGHPDLQQVRRAARHRRRVAGRPHPGRNRRAVSRARQVSAASATSRPMWSRSPRCWPRPAASRLEEIARQTTENFFRLFSKVRGAEGAA